MNWLFAFLCLVISVETAIADDPDPKQTAAENLLPNGDFDLGEITPKHWQTIDGLSTFWLADPDPKRGRVLKFDTDVQQAQAYVWWKKISEGTSPLGAPKKLPTVEPKYDTLAGLDGVWFWSDAIPVEKGAEYWLTLDAKGAGMLVWLVGYPEQPDCSFAADEGAVRESIAKQNGMGPPNVRNRQLFVHKYVWKGQLAVQPSADWKTFSRREKPFAPTKNTPNVKYVRVLLYPFWPPGEYFVDNVRLTRHSSTTQ